MEAPKLQTSNPERNFEYFNEKNGKKFIWKIKVFKENIEFSIKDSTNFLNSQYQRIFSKKELEKMNKFFLIFEDMNSISLEIERRLKNNLYEFYEDSKNISITFKIEITEIKPIDFIIPLKETKDTNSLIQQLFDYIKKVDEKVQLLENENKEIKKELNLLKEKEKEKITKLNKFKGSKIIETLQEEEMISEWIKTNNFSTQLLYRCSEDGDASSTFHDKCNGKSPTIVFVKTKANYKLGGYTTAKWQNKEEFSYDKNAFIFSLTNKKKYLIKNNNDAIYGGKINGPIFGYNELYIRNNCLSAGGENYGPKNYDFNKEGELTGDQGHFKVTEYEVYLIK